MVNPLLPKGGGGSGAPFILHGRHILLLELCSVFLCIHKLIKTHILQKTAYPSALLRYQPPLPFPSGAKATLVVSDT